jgi:Flp pilus assembly protein TadG
MVEFALITPILLILIGGIADFGFLFQSFEVTTNAAREGARLAVLPGFSEDPYTAAKKRVADYIQSANLLGTFVTNIDQETFNVGDEANPIEVQGVKVTVTYTHPMWVLGPIVGLIGQTFDNSLTYNTVARMRTEIQAAP